MNFINPAVVGHAIMRKNGALQAGANCDSHRAFFKEQLADLREAILKDKISKSNYLPITDCSAGCTGNSKVVTEASKFGGMVHQQGARVGHKRASIELESSTSNDSDMPASKKQAKSGEVLLEEPVPKEDDEIVPSELLVKQLKVELKKRGFPCGGKKAVLIQRLEEALLEEKMLKQENATESLDGEVNIVAEAPADCANEGQEEKADVNIDNSIASSTQNDIADDISTRSLVVEVSEACTSDDIFKGDANKEGVVCSNPASVSNEKIDSEGPSDKSAPALSDDARNSGSGLLSKLGASFSAMFASPPLKGDLINRIPPPVPVAGSCSKPATATVAQTSTKSNEDMLPKASSSKSVTVVTDTPPKEVDNKLSVAARVARIEKSAIKSAKKAQIITSALPAKHAPKHTDTDTDTATEAETAMDLVPECGTLTHLDSTEMLTSPHKLSDLIRTREVLRQRDEMAAEGTTKTPPLVPEPAAALPPAPKEPLAIESFPKAEVAQPVVEINAPSQPENTDRRQGKGIEASGAKKGADGPEKASQKDKEKIKDKKPAATATAAPTPTPSTVPAGDNLGSKALVAKSNENKDKAATASATATATTSSASAPAPAPASSTSKFLAKATASAGAGSVANKEPKEAAKDRIPTKESPTATVQVPEQNHIDAKEEKKEKKEKKVDAAKKDVKAHKEDKGEGKGATANEVSASASAKSSSSTTAPSASANKAETAPATADSTDAAPAPVPAPAVAPATNGTVRRPLNLLGGIQSFAAQITAMNTVNASSAAAASAAAAAPPVASLRRAEQTRLEMEAKEEERRSRKEALAKRKEERAKIRQQILGVGPAAAAAAAAATTTGQGADTASAKQAPSAAAEASSAAASTAASFSSSFSSSSSAAALTSASDKDRSGASKATDKSSKNESNIPKHHTGKTQAQARALPSTKPASNFFKPTSSHDNQHHHQQQHHHHHHQQQQQQASATASKVTLDLTKASSANSNASSSSNNALAGGGAGAGIVGLGKGIGGPKRVPRRSMVGKIPPKSTATATATAAATPTPSTVPAGDSLGSKALVAKSNENKDPAVTATSTSKTTAKITTGVSSASDTSAASAAATATGATVTSKPKALQPFGVLKLNNTLNQTSTAVDKTKIQEQEQQQQQQQQQPLKAKTPVKGYGASTPSSKAVTRSGGTKGRHGAALRHPLNSPGDTYELSDNDDSDGDYDSDEISERRRGKKIPSWALGSNLQAAYKRQFVMSKSTIDPDTIFGDIDTCNLEVIFQSRSSRYSRRTSSANWTRDQLSVKEKVQYKNDMGFI